MYMICPEPLDWLVVVVSQARTDKPDTSDIMVVLEVPGSIYYYGIKGTEN